ncbi:MAG: hypothetical protein AB7V46_08625 [Thermomicrobiales bacterium]
MSSRADLRTMLRRRLEDTTGTPLWDDATLNDVLAEALSHYGIRFPAERTLTLAVTEGLMSVPVSPYLERSEVLAVRDGSGQLLPQQRGHATGSGLAASQSWRWWNGELLLSRPAAAGAWEIDHLGRRQLPGNDGDAVEIRQGDEEIVVLLGAASALLRRAVELGKRGAESAGLTLTRVAERHTREAEKLMSSRRRRATGGWIAE